MRLPDFRELAVSSQWNKARIGAAFLIILSAVIAWLVVQTSETSAASPASPGTMIGSPAPDFVLKTTDGDTISLSDIRGQPVVINFFASWCEPCRVEAPVIRALVSDSSTNGYTVLGIAFRDDRDAAVRFMVEESLFFPVALDSDGKVGRAYRVVGPPTTFFLDGQGVIRHMVMGPLTLEQMQEGVRQSVVGTSSLGEADSVGIPGLWLAAGLGLLSFLSPCVLPLLPAYLGFISGLSVTELTGGSAQGQRKSIGRVLAFTLGLVLAFTALGASATLLGSLLTEYRSALTRMSGVAVIALGLHLTGIVRIPFLHREYRPGLALVGSGASGGTVTAFGTGVAFAVGWTPCVGPALGTILLLASQQHTIQQGMLLLLAYGLGLGIPFVITGLLVNRVLGRVKKLHPYLGVVEKLSGGLLIGTGILLALDQLAALGFWLNQRL